MTSEPLPGHEILTEPFLRQWGAVQGMKSYYIAGPNEIGWCDDSGYGIDRDPNIHEYIFSAPLGTMALVSTPLPEPVCLGCDRAEYAKVTITFHELSCPGHPSNRLVKVLPGLLVGLEEKPEGLIWGFVANLMPIWEDYGGLMGEFPFRGAPEYAYALPARVLAEIGQKVEMLPQSEGFDTRDSAFDRFTASTSEEVKPCQTTTLACNAAHPKSQPSEVAATNPEGKTCSVCNWTNSKSGVLNLGSHGWICHGCIQRHYDQISVPATPPGTPRTDTVLEANGIRCACSEKPIELARTLETELAAVTAERDSASKQLIEAHNEIENITVEHAQACATLARDTALAEAQKLRELLESATRIFDVLDTVTWDENGCPVNYRDAQKDIIRALQPR